MAATPPASPSTRAVPSSAPRLAIRDAARGPTAARRRLALRLQLQALRLRRRRACASARFFLAGTARELADDGVIAGAEPLQRRFDVIDRFEGVEAVAASAELAGGLRSAQKE